jgi:hypothetical protein
MLMLMFKKKSKNFTFSKIFFTNFSKKNTNLIHINNFSRKSFSSKDDQFWEDYTKRKAQGGRYPALEGQEIIYNKIIHSWKYSDKHSLTKDEFLISLRELVPKEESPFIILDVREESEYDLYKLPRKTKVYY